ncbi:MAG: selenium metabolism-associated LysR family transcriptional regulator [Peptococcaceae bacterium]
MLSDSMRVFLTVVDKKSFSKAAKSLFLTQPAVSFQIQMLEEYYGTRLFDRISRNITLTEAGNLLWGYAKDMSQQQKELERKIQELTGTTKGKLVIGASTTIGEYIIPYLLGAFKKKYPEVEISLDVGNTEDVENGITNTTLDLGLVEGPVNSKEIEEKIFLKDQLVLITSQHHPLAEKENVSVFELEKYPFILREKGSGTRIEMEKHLKNAGFLLNNLKVVLELGSTSAIKRAVQSGLGISIISKWAAREKVRRRQIHEAYFIEDKFERHFSIIVHKKKFRTQAVDEFINFLNTKEALKVVESNLI